MIKLLTICSVIMLLAAAPALANDDSIRPYIGFFAGGSFNPIATLSDSSGAVNTDFNPGLLGGLTVGASMGTNWGDNIERLRVEAEVSYRTNELTQMNNSKSQSASVNGTVSVTNFMLNGYLENPNILTKEMPMSLFLTAGAGAAIASITEISYNSRTLVTSGKNTQLAFQGGMGIGSELTKNITIDLTSVVSQR